MKNKLRVGILFGGKSAEHEISLQSAKNVFDALDRDKYEPVLIGIDKSGRWLLNDEQRLFLGTDDPACLQLNPASDEVTFVLGEKGELANLSANKNKQPLDVVFPILHGPFGEDGTVQGFLKLAEIPFVGAGVLASSVSMDKDVMKRLLRDAGLPIGKFRPLSRLEKAPVYESLCQSLGSPFFVKPANMGSSVGISKVRSADEYLPALNLAFEYDNKVVIEEYISGRELECSVLGNE
jgi:D-alanine-D-alanine ligase